MSRSLSCSARISASGARLWSIDEHRILRCVYPRATVEQILAALPGLSWPQIINQANKRKIKRERGRWSREQLDLLALHYPTMGARCASLIGIYRSAVAKKASALGIAFIYPPAHPRPPRVKTAQRPEAPTAPKAPKAPKSASLPKAKVEKLPTPRVYALSALKRQKAEQKAKREAAKQIVSITAEKIRKLCPVKDYDERLAYSLGGARGWHRFKFPDQYRAAGQ